MKTLEFKDVTGEYEDADGDKHTSTVRAAVVTEDTAFVSVLNNEGDRVKRRREVTLRDGTARPLNAGDVVVETDRPDVYDVHTAEQWKGTAYGAKSSPSLTKPAAK